MLPELEQEPAADQHGSTPGQEGDAPEDPLLPWRRLTPETARDRKLPG
jgi:hypothetical protein